jgi:hypothetical protein
VIPTILILAGMVMMVWPCGLAGMDKAAVGHLLREAFSRPTHEPLPPEIEEASRQVAARLRLVRTGE